MARFADDVTTTGRRINISDMACAAWFHNALSPLPAETHLIYRAGTPPILLLGDSCSKTQGAVTTRSKGPSLDSRLVWTGPGLGRRVN